MCANGEPPQAIKHIFGEMYQTHHRKRNRFGFIFGGRERGERFRAWVGTGRRVLDIGCRDGALTRYYAAGNEVVGLDIDRRALGVCAQELSIEARWADFNQGLPFDDAYFDVVVAGEVLEHSISPALLVAEIARVLRPEGTFIGSVPNAFRLKNRLRFLIGREIEHDETHLHMFSVRALRTLLEKYFCQVRIVPIASRFLWLSPWLFANDLLWQCQKQ
jgi:SAM-dependent methyltransferase